MWRVNSSEYGWDTGDIALRESIVITSKTDLYEFQVEDIDNFQEYGIFSQIEYGCSECRVHGVSKNNDIRQEVEPNRILTQLVSFILTENQSWAFQTSVGVT